MINSILRLGDCLEIMSTLPDNSIDMVITSPPYNVGVNYNGKGENADKLPLKVYQEWALSVTSNITRLLISGGRMCLELGGAGRNFPLDYIWQDAAYKNGLGLFGALALEHRKTNPTAWGSWLKADAVNTIPNFHMLYIFYKDTPRKTGGETTINKADFVEWTRGYWHISYSAGSSKQHPATFPLELPKRCMLLFGHKNDLVLDPFAGTGTTCIACIQNQRNFLGIEIESKYYEIAKKRIEEEKAIEVK